jgi:hypothetical protein
MNILNSLKYEENFAARVLISFAIAAHDFPAFYGRIGTNRSKYAHTALRK